MVKGNQREEENISKNNILVQWLKKVKGKKETFQKITSWFNV